MSSVTYQYDEEAVPALQALLEERGFQLGEAPHAHFSAKATGCSVTFYKSGKLLIQGKDAPFVAGILAPVEVLGGHEGLFAKGLDQLPTHTGERWIGTDESGKGDFFGPLVVCGVVVQRDQLALLAELGVADSKSLNDQKIREMAPGLREVVRHAEVVLMPRRYNTLYADMGRNLNRLLAWGHARVIEDLLQEEDDVRVAVIDRFGPERRITSALMERGKRLEIVQRPRAEDDPAVAAASVLARDTFVRRLYWLGSQYRIKLAKGAGPPVLAAARRFVRDHGKDALSEVAKVHFKTVEHL